MNLNLDFYNNFYNNNKKSNSSSIQSYNVPTTSVSSFGEKKMNNIVSTSATSTTLATATEIPVLSNNAYNKMFASNNYKNSNNLIINFLQKKEKETFYYYDKIKSVRGLKEYEELLKSQLEIYLNQKKETEKTMFSIKKYLDYVKSANNGISSPYLGSFENKYKIDEVSIPDLIGITKKEKQALSENILFIFSLTTIFLKSNQEKNLYECIIYLLNFFERKKILTENISIKPANTKVSATLTNSTNTNLKGKKESITVNTEVSATLTNSTNSNIKEKKESIFIKEEEYDKNYISVIQNINNFYFLLTSIFDNSKFNFSKFIAITKSKTINKIGGALNSNLIKFLKLQNKTKTKNKNKTKKSTLLTNKKDDMDKKVKYILSYEAILFPTININTKNYEDLKEKLRKTWWKEKFDLVLKNSLIKLLEKDNDKLPKIKDFNTQSLSAELKSGDINTIIRKLKEKTSSFSKDDLYYLKGVLKNMFENKKSLFLEIYNPDTIDKLLTLTDFYTSKKIYTSEIINKNEYIDIIQKIYSQYEKHYQNYELQNLLPEKPNIQEIKDQQKIGINILKGIGNYCNIARKFIENILKRISTNDIMINRLNRIKKEEQQKPQPQPQPQLQPQPQPQSQPQSQPQPQPQSQPQPKNQKQKNQKSKFEQKDKKDKRNKKDKKDKRDKRDKKDKKDKKKYNNKY
jgi:hypothetical protein